MVKTKVSWYCKWCHLPFSWARFTPSLFNINDRIKYSIKFRIHNLSYTKIAIPWTKCGQNTHLLSYMRIYKFIVSCSGFMQESVYRFNRQTRKTFLVIFLIKLSSFFSITLKLSSNIFHSSLCNIFMAKK